jgi:drug/metabolite transporter (DMT)-like permease
MKNQSTLFIVMLISMMFWGLSWPSAKVITQWGTPVNLTVYRYAIVVLTLFPILIWMKIPLKISKKGALFALISGILLASYSYFMFLGLKKGFAGAGGVFVTTLNPIMAYFLTIIIQRKKPSLFETLGLICGFLAGFVLLKSWENFDRLFLSGNLFFLLAAFLWAVMSRFTAVSSSFGSPFAFSFWMYVCCMVLLIPFMNVDEFLGLTQINDVYLWGNLIFGGAIVTSLATTVYFYATSKLGSDKASSFIFLVPFAAALSSWLLLGEIIEWHTVFGGVLGILAVFLIQRKGKKNGA